MGKALSNIFTRTATRAVQSIPARRFGNQFGGAPLSEFSQGGDDAANGETENRLRKTLNPNEPRKIVFGETVAPADVRYWEVWDDDKKYDEIISVASHKIQSFDANFYLETEQLTFDGNGDNQQRFGTNLNRDTKVEGVTATTLAAGAGVIWTSTSSMTGCAFYRLATVFDNELFPDGMPDRYTQVVKGALVYDPRLDGVNPEVGGTGAHDYNDQDTWEYVNGGTDLGLNPALQELWYLLGWKIGGKVVVGKGVEPEDIDFASFMQGASDCEANGWEGSCVLSMGDSDATNLAIIRSACNGVLTDAGGLYSFHAAINDTGVIAADYNESHFVGGSDWNQKSRTQKQFNSLSGTFIDPTALYNSRPFPTVENTTYVSDDGFAREDEVNFQTVQDSDKAQELLRIRLNETRFQGQFTVPMHHTALRVKHWDIVRISFANLNWTNKLFRVVRQGISTAGFIEMTFQETDSSIYGAGAISSLPTITPGAGYDAFSKIPMTGLGAVLITETGSAGTISDGLTFSWDDPGNLVTQSEVRFRITGDTPWLPAPAVRFPELESSMVPLESGTSYDFQGRHTTFLGVIGDWSATVVKVTGTDRDTEAGATLGAAWNTNIQDLPDFGAGIVEDPGFEKQASLNTAGGNFWEAGTNISFDTLVNLGAPVDASRLFGLEFDLVSSIMVTRIARDGTRIKVFCKQGDTIKQILRVAHDGNLTTTGNNDAIRLDLRERNSAGGQTAVGTITVNGGDVAADTWLTAVQDYTIQSADTSYVEIGVQIAAANGGTGMWWCNYFQVYFNALGTWLTEDTDTLLHRTSVDDVLFDLNAEARMDQGDATLRRMPNGMMIGAARDGDAFDFVPVFETPPTIIFGTGGLTYDPDNLDNTLKFHQNIVATSLTASGFIASTKLEELSGTPTVRTVTGDGSPPTFDWEGNKDLAAEAWDNNYEFNYDITIDFEPIVPGGNTAVVSFYTNTGSGFVLGATKNYHNSSTTTDLVITGAIQVVNRAGLGLNDDFAMDAQSVFGHTFTGGTDVDYFVEYEEATAGATTSATPVGATSIPFTVFDNADDGVVTL